ncbi:hypothetical protein [Shewanella sp. MBTL60-007]|uniref:hypothetical protein n=1 Tax=Shewanella sp. MBTL60-007 TaxID=2815911 RepID=UPI001BC4A69D|nr:hypothetical protein [Shewanella sp. MBTL60-007]GIU20961.1 hypothetical protein TUM3792_21250 [Shewanella sp. MBTL60-007]
MSVLLLPRLQTLHAENDFLRQLYLTSQSNLNIDPIWEGVAVILNDGADLKLSGTHWANHNKSVILDGGYDGRIGIVTQYENVESIEFMNKLYHMDAQPWVRVSCFINSNTQDVSSYESISIDARYCTTIPQSIYKKACSSIQHQYLEQTKRFSFDELLRERT